VLVRVVDRAASTPRRLPCGVRLHILSDLHLELTPFTPPPVDADVVILAGDLRPGTGGLDWAAGRWPDRPVVFVPGNHEYYGHTYPALDRKLEERATALGTQLHVLCDRAVVVDGIRFLGTTLWTDFALAGDAAVSMAAAQAQMSDFTRIRVAPGDGSARPTDTIAWHQRSLRWLRAALQEPHGGPTVVVTHHAPSRRSLNPLYADPMAAAYATHLDALVEESGAPLWIHGHTHHCVDYRLGRTRVVANQRGYPDEPVGGFDPGLVLDLADLGASVDR
jgi:predicted phosphodiesterase